MCFHIKSDGWQCFHYVSSSSPQSDFRGQRWLDHLQLSTQWAIVGRSSRKLDLSERSSWGWIKAFTEYYYLSFWEDLFISANFSFSGREFLGRRCAYRPRNQQFIWGQTRSHFKLYKYTHIWGCMCTLCDAAKEVCGRISRPQLCQICPNQTRRAEKTAAARQGLPSEETGGREMGGQAQISTSFL